MDSEWTCFNRKCISQALICNSVDDCGDGSDESNLHHTGCGGEMQINIEIIVALLLLLTV